MIIDIKRSIECRRRQRIVEQRAAEVEKVYDEVLETIDDQRKKGTDRPFLEKFVREQKSRLSGKLPTLEELCSVQPVTEMMLKWQEEQKEKEGRK